MTFRHFILLKFAALSKKLLQGESCATMNADRRSQKRKQPEQAVFCKLGGEESGSVLNLSEDGLCFEGVTPLQEKGLLQLRLSVGASSAIEATGQLAWIDSAKLTGGVRFVELSAPAREQISAWLSETSSASIEKNSAATEKPDTLREICVPSTQLVPIEHYRAKTRSQFLRGVLVGFGICSVLMIPIMWYASRTKPANSAPTAAGAIRPAQSSAEQAQATVQPATPRATVTEKTTTKTLATKQEAAHAVSTAAPARSLQRQPAQTTAPSSTDLMTRISSPSATPQPAKAEKPHGASPATVAPALTALQEHSSSGQGQPPKKILATPQQLWSAVQAGNISAAVDLADLYTRGEGVEVNCQQARVLLQVASEKNNVEAAKKLQQLNKGGCPARTSVTANKPRP